MTEEAYRHKLAKVLDRMGGLWLLDDLLTEIREGRMQSFARNNSWAIAQVNQFPRQRVLDIISIVGDLEDYDQLMADLCVYANIENCGVIRGYGRTGWKPFVERDGFKRKAINVVWQKDM